MNVYRLLFPVLLADGLRRLSREADSRVPDGVSVRGATDMRPVSRRGCWEVRLVPGFGDTTEDRCSVGFRGVMNDRFGADAPSVFGVMFKSLPERDGVRERDEVSGDGLRLLGDRFCVWLVVPSLDRRSLSGLRDIPASPTLDRGVDGLTACRLVEGALDGDRVTEVLLPGVVTLGDRLIDGPRDGVVTVSLLGVAVVGDRLGVVGDGVTDAPLGRFAEGVLKGVRVPIVLFRGVLIFGDRLGAADDGLAEDEFCRLAEGVLIGARVAGAAFGVGVMRGA